ncbi:MAG: MurR/RpiR family transcriptional regulator [Eubacteriales bacterium]|nr:MurR/RpiR family transcriptional regulator [Eubacteriales bacterium]
MFGVEQVKTLNDLEMSVYEYVMKHPEKVKYMRIRELASEAHVSTSTILRFCKKMDCNGYAEFKLKLKQLSGKDKPNRITDDITEVIDFLKKTTSDEFEDKLEMLSDMIMKSNRVFFVGSGMSGIVAKYGARYFSSMGKFCLYIDEPHYPTDSKSLDNALVIVFSVSGESKDTVGHILRFKEQNCRIISITNTENCTLARISDYNIAYYITYMRIKNYDVTSQLPAMSIIERLGKKLYQCSKGADLI